MSGSDQEYAKEILQQINKLRKYPKTFIPILEDHLQYFEGNALFLPSSQNGGVLMEEGPQAYRDAIQFLKSLKDPLPEIQWNECLERAAIDHLKDIGPKGILSHTGSDKSNYKQRIEKHCKWGGSIFEAIDYGMREQARDVVTSWLIDDGVQKRMHRNNLFFKDHTQCGIAYGFHKASQQCSIAIFAAQVVTKEQIQQQSIPSIDKKRQEQMKNKDWSQFAAEVFEAQNKLRQNPQSLVPHLDKCLQRFNNRVLMTGDGKSGFETQEGQIAYVEAIEFLMAQKPLPPLKWAPQLEKAAQDHINDIGPKGIISSLGSDGSLPTDRLARYCMIDESWAESLCFQTISANEVIERLLVDDGQPTRGHRKNMFNKEMQYCGVSTGLHSQLDNVVLLEYAKGILKDGELPSINVTVQEEVPQELIQKMKLMGIDIGKIKVKKDTKDANLKAQQLFKKATNAITFANRINKKVNEKIAHITEDVDSEIQESDKQQQQQQRPQSSLQQKKTTTVVAPTQKHQPMVRPGSSTAFAKTKATPLEASSKANTSNIRRDKVSENSKASQLQLRKSQSPFQRALEEKKSIQNQLKKSVTAKQQSPKDGNSPSTNGQKSYLDKLKKSSTSHNYKQRQDNTTKYSSNQSKQDQNKSKVVVEIEEEKVLTKKKGNQEFNIENDPDMPEDAVNSNVIIEEIEMNGRKQKVYRKTYQLIDGRTVAITKMEQM